MASSTLKLQSPHCSLAAATLRQLHNPTLAPHRIQRRAPQLRVRQPLKLRSSLDHPSTKPDGADCFDSRTIKSLKPQTLAPNSSKSESSSSSCHATGRRSLVPIPVSDSDSEYPRVYDYSSLEHREQGEAETSSTQTGGSVLGAIALITGTSVGAGILALPQETSSAGFLPSATLLIASWAFLTLEAFLIADVNVGLLNKRRQQNSTSSSGSETSGSDVISLRTMADQTLGPLGGILSSATYVFLSYTLVVAYIAKAADVATLSIDIPYNVAAAAFVAALGGLVYAGNTQTTDWANRIMTGGLLTLFFTIVLGGSLNADWSQLSHQDWSQAPGTLPVVFLSLVFHDLIPVLCTYLDGDLKRVRTAIAVGGAVPLAMFLLWDAVALSLSGGVTGVDPLEVLMSLGGPSQGALIQGFSILAVMTSFIGTALSFSEFFIEQLNSVVPRLGARGSRVSKEANGDERTRGQVSKDVQSPATTIKLSRKQVLRAVAFGLVLVPSWSIACSIPDAFFTASEAAGGYGMTVLYGIFPPLMFWNARQQAAASAETRNRKDVGNAVREWWDRPAGGLALASMGACAFSVILSQIALDTAVLRREGSDAAPVGSEGSPVVVLASTTPVSHLLQSTPSHETLQMSLQEQALQAPLVESEESENMLRRA